MIKSKRGQFYLIAAIAIILIILGLATVPNNLKKEGTDNTKIYELFAEINIDDAKMLNYPYTVTGIFGYTEAELENIFDKMTETYPVVEKIYFIINKNGLPKLYVYDKNSDEEYKITEPYASQQISLSNLEIEGTEYNFGTMSTNSYYLIIIEKKDQQYVVKA